MPLQHVTFDTEKHHSTTTVKRYEEMLVKHGSDTKRGTADLGRRYLEICLFLHQLAGPAMVVSGQLLGVAMMRTWITNGFAHMGVAHPALNKLCFVSGVLYLGFSFSSLEPRLRRVAIILGNLVFLPLLVLWARYHLSYSVSQLLRMIFFLFVFLLGQIVLSEIFAARMKKQSGTGSASLSPLR